MSDKPLDDSPLLCGEVYHLMRMAGDGSDYVLPLYQVSARVAHESGRFFLNKKRAAPYFACHRNQLSNAAGLLVRSGFWTVLESIPGRAVQYHPLNHEEWLAADPARAAQCCKKLEMPWDGEEQDPLGKALFGATGGVKFYPNVLTGWRNLGLSDEKIVACAKEFMASSEYAHTHDRDGRLLSSRLRHTRGKAFRKAFGAALKAAAEKV
jgi:hypothetical protein